VYGFTHGSPNPSFYHSKFLTSRELCIRIRKTRAKISDTERDLRLPSSPIVEKNMWSPYVNLESGREEEDDDDES